MDKNVLLITALTQAEAGGLSVLRGHATDAEFIEVARRRIATRIAKVGDTPIVHGVAEFSCVAVRGLATDVSSLGRQPNERLFCVFDTDEPALPSHADIFQTWPENLSNTKGAASRKSDRKRLLDIVSATIITADQFRGGFLAAL